MRCKVCDTELKKGLEIKLGFCEECICIMKKRKGGRAFLARMFGFEKTIQVDPEEIKKRLKGSPLKESALLQILFEIRRDVAMNQSDLRWVKRLLWALVTLFFSHLAVMHFGVGI